MQWTTALSLSSMSTPQNRKGTLNLQLFSQRNQFKEFPIAPPGLQLQRHAVVFAASSQEVKSIYREKGR